MIQEEDERCLHKYRRQCMQEMHERLSFGPKFDAVFELDSGEAFLDVIEKEHHLTIVVVHIYDDGITGCDALNNCLTCLAAEYSSVNSAESEPLPQERMSVFQTTFCPPCWCTRLESCWATLCALQSIWMRSSSLRMWRTS